MSHVAHALHRLGAAAAGVTLLRGALRRDAGQGGLRRQLEELVAGAGAQSTGEATELDLGLVDGWIRNGMLVEALALLGGTSLGSGEMGREWANLLGELLAPLPVEAEQALVQVYEELLSGGASVALSLLEERDKREPAMPTWATRRLELLRWMLLDNAEVAQSFVVGDHLHASELAGVLEVAEQRGLRVGHLAVKSYAEEHPADGDAARTLEAIELILADLDRQASRIGKSNNTMPMVGHTAALMQLRMGNLRPAAKIYRSLVETKADDRASLLLAEVEVLLRVLDGQPAEDGFEALEGEATQMRASDPGGGAFEDEPTDLDAAQDPESDDPALSDWPLPKTDRQQQLATELGPPEGVDFAATTRHPSADQRAEQLIAEGRLKEAEEVYEGLLDIAPDHAKWRSRVGEVRVMMAGDEVDPDGVLVRVTLPVK